MTSPEQPHRASGPRVALLGLAALALVAGAFVTGRVTAPEQDAATTTTTVPLGQGTLPDPAQFAPTDEPAFPLEGTYVTAHVELSINGDPDPIPAGIGVWESDGVVSGYGIVHTRDASGTVYIPAERLATLGDLFRVWGVKLNVDQGCIAEQCLTGDVDVTVSIDGQRFDGDVLTAPLKEGSSVVLVFGVAPEASPDFPSPLPTNS